jgi:hypothetical protein
MLGFTYIAVTSAVTYLGTTSGIICLITFILLGYFIIDIFQSIFLPHTKKLIIPQEKNHNFHLIGTQNQLSY